MPTPTKTLVFQPAKPIAGWLAGALVWATAAACAAAQTAAHTAACDAADFQTVLHASPAMVNQPATPQAVWLNRQWIQWPDAAQALQSPNTAIAIATAVTAATSSAPAEGRYRLYFSRNAQLSATPGAAVIGADGALSLSPTKNPVPPALATRFKYVKPGVVLTLRPQDVGRLPRLLQQQLWLVQEDDSGRVLRSTSLQLAGALDDLYASAARITDLGATPLARSGTRQTQLKLWAPTAQQVTLCHYATATSSAAAVVPMARDSNTGVWSVRQAGAVQGHYYTYLVDGVVAGVGVVRNKVTDPYSISLNADSKRSFIADLNSASLKPVGWDRDRAPARVKVQTDMVIYELHVRDFSLDDLTVPAAHRGKYLAFTAARSNGMRHLTALSQAGMTDVHLLPIFDLATVPEAGCVAPDIAPPANGDSEAPQATVLASAARDCYNWGYDPYHFNAPEGSFATDANDGAKRILELRQMVMALHAAKLRVGMDVVYNHTTSAGQNENAVLDRIVPGYYQRLDAMGKVERSTCCDNTATENLMMAKLMLDSVDLWARHYKIDSFRFDLMAHQPRDVMEVLQARVNKAAGRPVNLIGEGWNFGEVANGARFVQASQLSLNGTGIGTFSDRGRDAVRGGSAGDNGEAQIINQGYINGMVYDRNALSKASPADLLRTADMVRVGLAGSLREFEMLTHTGQRKKLAAIDYAGQPAGYVTQPAEVVNYIENHDNQTLYDLNVFRLPVGTSSHDRVRVQMLGVAINAFSQGVAYFHAGTEVLRSKSMDRNSYDSGDWFNRLDWTYQDNYFGTGLPPKADNGASWAIMKPLLADPRNRPAPADIALARDVFNDLLRIRDSSTLFRMRTAADIQARLSFPNTGPDQNPVVLAGHLKGKGYAGAAFQEVIYLINVDKTPQVLTLPTEVGKAYQMHPVQAARNAADARVRDEAAFEAPSGRFTVPARSAVVFVVR